MHIGIIMDGNGRWALRRGLPRSAGHRAGAQSVDRVVEAAAQAGVQTLTLFAFSAANWRRPTGEVDALFSLFRRYLLAQTPRCIDQSIRINVIGRRDRLDRDLRAAIERSERLTANCSRMLLRLAVDYSSQQTLMTIACQSARPRPYDYQSFIGQLACADHSVKSVPALDLLIRTGGEHRLSDFLLWECAFAELIFSDLLWPDFGQAQFADALQEFATRERRFGGIDQPQKDAAHG